MLARQRGTANMILDFDRTIFTRVCSRCLTCSPRSIRQPHQCLMRRLKLLLWKTTAPRALWNVANPWILLTGHLPEYWWWYHLDSVLKAWVDLMFWIGQHPNFASPRGFTRGCLAKPVSGEEPRPFNCIPFIPRVSDPSNIKDAIESGMPSATAPWGQAKTSSASALGPHFTIFDGCFLFSGTSGALQSCHSRDSAQCIARDSVESSELDLKEPWYDYDWLWYYLIACLRA